MNELQIADNSEESLVPTIFATAVVTVAAVIAVKGLYEAAKTIRRNSKEKKALAAVLTETTEETN